jgi:ankyrin repeat protein
MLAAWLNPEPMVIRSILFAGADPTIKDNNGETAFDAALKNPNTAVVEVLAPFRGEAEKSEKVETDPEKSPSKNP